MGEIEIRLSKEQINALTDILTVTSTEEVRERIVGMMGETAQDKADRAADAVEPLFYLFLALL
jgi:uncharacterized small protein (DUF1192 family)